MRKSKIVQFPRFILSTNMLYSTYYYHQLLIALLTFPNSQLIYHSTSRIEITFFSFFCFASRSCFFFSRRLSIELNPYMVMASSPLSSLANKSSTNPESYSLATRYFKTSSIPETSTECAERTRLHLLPPQSNYSMAARISSSFFSVSSCLTVTIIFFFGYNSENQRILTFSIVIDVTPGIWIMED